APHAWLSDGRSTLDLFGRGYTLLRLSTNTPVTALEDAAREQGVPLTTIDIDDDAIAQLYERALVLVRPDGFVAWRADALPTDCAHLVATVRGVHATAAHAAA